MYRILALASMALTVSLSLTACGTPYPPAREKEARETPAAPVDPSNTVNNQRDRGDTVLPTDQSERAPDLRVTADIRKAIVDDPSMSTNARNVKIVTAKGTITLRGVVQSEAEKAAVLSKADALRGSNQIEDKLEVVPKTN